MSDSGRSHCFFSWGDGGGEEEATGQVLLSRFRRTTRAFKEPHFLCYILYIEQWRFRCCMLQTIAKSALDLDALGSARALLKLRQPVDLVYASIYVKGLLLLVPSPRSGGYDVYIHAVYVLYVICLLYRIVGLLLQSGGGTWGTALYTVRGVGSGSRDVDAWRANGSVRRGSGAPSTDGPGAWLPTPRHLQW